MSETKHTSGPWRTESEVDGRHHVVAIMADAAAEHPLIAQALHGLGRVSKETALANARLIAAAPELLAACQAAEANLSPMYSREHLVMKLLRDAIAKAEGTL